MSRQGFTKDGTLPPHLSLQQFEAHEYRIVQHHGTLLVVPPVENAFPLWTVSMEMRYLSLSIWLEKLKCCSPLRRNFCGSYKWRTKTPAALIFQKFTVQVLRVSTDFISLSSLTIEASEQAELAKARHDSNRQVDVNYSSTVS